MLREWIDRLKAGRRERIAEEYGNLSAEERLDLQRQHDDLDAGGRGVEETFGRQFDQELDAEEGRPRH